MISNQKGQQPADYAMGIVILGLCMFALVTPLTYFYPITRYTCLDSYHHHLLRFPLPYTHTPPLDLQNHRHG